MKSWSSMKPHELCGMIPDMTPEQYEQLVEDIGRHGLLEPITLYEGMILDGRHRYRACLELQERGHARSLRFHEFRGDQVAAKAYILSRNLHRRYLTYSQRAALAAMFKREAQESGMVKHGGDRTKQDCEIAALPGEAAQIAANKFQVGQRSVYEAEAVLEKAPELFEQMVDGGIDLRAAQREIKRRNPRTEADWLRVYDVWNFTECADGLGQEHPGRIPGQIVLNVVHYFTAPGDLVVDPMAGGGVTIDACTALDRRCTAFDVDPRRDEIARHDARKPWPVKAHSANLVFIDPPYFDMRAKDYSAESISALPLQEFYAAMKRVMRHAWSALAKGGRLAVLISPSASPEHGFINHQHRLLLDAADIGFIQEWQVSVPQSSQTLNTREVAWAKQHNRMLSLVRDLLILRRPDAGSPLCRSASSGERP